jgi:hypothetical protein
MVTVVLDSSKLSLATGLQFIEGLSASLFKASDKTVMLTSVSKSIHKCYGSSVSIRKPCKLLLIFLSHENIFYCVVTVYRNH